MAEAWHPVDTTPEDGSQILVAYRGLEGEWLTTVLRWLDGDWQLVETDTHAFDAKAMIDFELWKPIELPHG